MNCLETEYSIPKVNNQFICNICSKTTTHRHTLLEHLLSHRAFELSKNGWDKTLVYVQRGSALTKYEIKKAKKAVSEQERRDQKKEEALKMAEKVK